MSGSLQFPPDNTDFYIGEEEFDGIVLLPDIETPGKQETAPSSSESPKEEWPWPVAQYNNTGLAAEEVY